jgi:hypothetical protein
MYIDTTNVGNEMYDYTSNKRSHQNCNKWFKEKGKHSIDSLQKTSHITHNMESTSV